MSTSSYQHDGTSQIKPLFQIGRFLRRIHCARAEILEYNQDTKRLSVWSWPIDITTGERVTPEALYKRNLDSDISRPRCLCLLLETDMTLVFQASIERARAGLHAGELVIRCASGRCGYVAPLERIYKHGDYGRSFLPRDSYDPARRHPLEALITRRALKRTYATFNILGAQQMPPLQPHQPQNLHFTIARMEAPIHRPTTDTDFLTRLDSWTQPGLYGEEFRGLMGRMAQCSCGMIMMRKVFDGHRCKESLLRPLKRARGDDSNKAV